MHKPLLAAVGLFLLANCQVNPSKVHRIRPSDAGDDNDDPVAVPAQPDAAAPARQDASTTQIPPPVITTRDDAAAPSPDLRAPDPVPTVKQDAAPPTPPPMAALTCPPPPDAGVPAKATPDAGSDAGHDGGNHDAQTPPAGGTDNALYGFEVDTQGWKDQDAAQMSAFAKSTTTVYKGKGALEITLNTTAAGQERYIVVDKDFPPRLGACTTVTLHVWLPADGSIKAIQPFTFGQTADSQNRWLGNYMDAGHLKAGDWNTVTVTTPPDLATPKLVGIQFIPNAAGTVKVYLDSVTW